MRFKSKKVMLGASLVPALAVVVSLPAQGRSSAKHSEPPPDRSSEPAWSSDGRCVAFRGGNYPDSEIWIANADGSGAVRITHNQYPDEFPV